MYCKAMSEQAIIIHPLQLGYDACAQHIWSCLYFCCPVILAAIRSGFSAVTAAICCMPSLAVVSAVDA